MNKHNDTLSYIKERVVCGAMLCPARFSRCIEKCMLLPLQGLVQLDTERSLYMSSEAVKLLTGHAATALAQSGDLGTAAPSVTAVR
jgi:hypothetical protein